MFIIYRERCLQCGGCVPICPVEALILLKEGITCDEALCMACGDCILFCPVDVLELQNEYQL